MERAAVLHAPGYIVSQYVAAFPEGADPWLEHHDAGKCRLRSSRINLGDPQQAFEQAGELVGLINAAVMALADVEPLTLVAVFDLNNPDETHSYSALDLRHWSQRGRAKQWQYQQMFDKPSDPPSPGRTIEFRLLRILEEDRPELKSLRRALTFRAEAEAATDPTLRFLLAVTSVEALTPIYKWSKEAKKLRDALADVVVASGLDGEEAADLQKGISTLGKVGVSEGILRMLKSLNLDDRAGAWSEIYKHRSRVLHGSETPEKIRAMAENVLALSRTIVRAATLRAIPGLHPEQPAVSQ